MSDKIKELLSILDLTGDEQETWVYKNILKYEAGGLGHNYKGFPIHTLADLAFRMRDETVKSYWGSARVRVFRAIKDVAHFGAAKYLEQWWDRYAQPIHWIIAALIAKEMRYPKKLT
jgi:hypothetical protein